MRAATSVLQLAVVAWLGLTIAVSLSERTYQLLDEDGLRSLYSDKGLGTALNWIDKNKNGFSCLFLQGSGVRYCGMNIQLGDGVRKGIDFSEYSKLRLGVEYIGPAEKIRIFFRNVVQDTDLTQDSKFHQVEIPIRNGAYRYEIPLDNFDVALWWLESKNLLDVPEHHIAQRDSVIHLGFDIETPVPVGQHYFNVENFSLVTPWFQRTSIIWWALGSIVYFVVVGFIYNFLRLRTQLEQHHNEMFGLLKKLEVADTESAHFKRLSMYDPLTGLLNRRAAMDLVEEFARHNSLVGTGLVVLDIDHFKQVNDTYGHDLGDEVLQRAGAVVQQVVREADAAVRWGGEEIVVICPKTNLEGAYRVAEKLQAAIKQLSFSHSDLTISASFGVANIRQGESFSQALGRADEALYDAKKNGRDQICGYQDRTAKT